MGYGIHTSCRLSPWGGNSDPVEFARRCPGNPQVDNARPEELEIVCGEHSLLYGRPTTGDSKEVTLPVKEVVNHPSFSMGFEGEKKEGPYSGYDLAVYKVHLNSVLRAKMKERRLWPACLPKGEEEYLGSRALWVGWDDPGLRSRPQNTASYTTQEYIAAHRPRQVQLEASPCQDPAWMNSSTFYPAGTQCFQDPTWFSCPDYGNTGSGVFRPFAAPDGEARFAYTGPLSMTKGCDQTWIDADGSPGTEDPGIVFSASNPSVVTDLRCHLPWVAEQYGMRMEEGYTVPAFCHVSVGVWGDLEQASCKGQEMMHGAATPNLAIDSCDFSFDGKPTINGRPTFLPEMLYDKCILFSRGAVSLLSKTFKLDLPDKVSTYGYLCANSTGALLNCAANCRGVDPNAMACGGIAVLAATAAVGVSYLGLGAAGLAVGGGSMARVACMTPFCKARSGQCCLLNLVRGRIRCPTQC